MKYIYFLSLALMLVGCASTIVDVTPLPTGGSKSDGTIISSYQYNPQNIVSLH